VCPIGLRVDTLAITERKAWVTHTTAIDTLFATGAFGATFPTVERINFEVGTTICADFWCISGTFDLALGIDTQFPSGAWIVALGTMGQVLFGVDALSITYSLSNRTLTLASNAGCTTRAFFVACPAVVAVGLGVGTAATANGGRALWTIDITG
jgi:hypothetical protein